MKPRKDELIVAKILFLEDEKMIREVLSEYMMVAGHEVIPCERGDDALALVEEGKDFDLAVLDIRVPGASGLEVLQAIKAKMKEEVGTIMLTAYDDINTQLEAFHFLADDYITKPINIHLVRVKIQALLRRTYDYALSTDNLIFGSLKLNLSAAKLESSEKSIDLTHTELLILETLFKAKGDIAKRDSIMDHCWQSDNFIDDNTLAVNMTRLRKKLSEIGFDDLIQTKKGIGYYLKEGK